LLIAAAGGAVFLIVVAVAFILWRFASAPKDDDKKAAEGQIPKGSVALAEVVPGDSWLFASVSGELWTAPGLESIRKEMGPFAEKEFQDKIGFPIADLERVSLFPVTSFAEGKKSQRTVVLVLVQTKRPFDQDVVGKALKELSKNESMKVEFITDQTFLLVPEALLPVYQGKKGKQKASGVLERALTAAATSKGLVLALDVPPEAVKDAEAAGKDFMPFLAPFLKTKSVFATFDITDRLRLSVSLGADDAGTAHEMKGAAAASVGFGTILLAQMAQQPDMAPFIKLGQQALKDLKFDVQDKEFTVAYETDPAALVKMAQSAVGEQMRLAGEKAIDVNNLRQLALAWQNYADAHKTFPPQTIGKGLSWRVAILPHIGQDNLYKLFKLDEPWNSPHNLKLLPLMPKVFELSKRRAEPGRTFYQTFVGPNTINKTPTTALGPLQIPDGTTNTLILAEASRAVEWTKPEDINVVAGGHVDLGGSDPVTFLAAFADGRVQRLRRNLDQQTLRWLIDPADGNAIPDLDGPGKK
jgi:hypothetical protein